MVMMIWEVVLPTCSILDKITQHMTTLRTGAKTQPFIIVVQAAHVTVACRRGLDEK
jgi:hypothetical protein